MLLLCITHVADSQYDWSSWPPTLVVLSADNGLTKLVTCLTSCHEFKIRLQSFQTKKVPEKVSTFRPPPRSSPSFQSQSAPPPSWRHFTASLSPTTCGHAQGVSPVRAREANPPPQTPHPGGAVIPLQKKPADNKTTREHFIWFMIFINASSPRSFGGNTTRSALPLFALGAQVGAEGRWNELTRYARDLLAEIRTRANAKTILYSGISGSYLSNFIIHYQPPIRK